MRRFAMLAALAAFAVVVAPGAAAGSGQGKCQHWQGDPDTPCLVLTPTSGPAGTHVRFHGTIRSDLIARYNDEWHNHPFYGLTGEFPASTRFPQGCELIIPAAGLKIALSTSTGVVEGSFTVGRQGTCSQTASTSGSPTRHPTMPGAYSLFVGSLSTYIAAFQVTDGTVTSPATTTPRRAKPARHARSQPTPTGLPYTGPPILQLSLLGGAVFCAGVALAGVPRAPAGRRRANA